MAPAKHSEAGAREALASEGFTAEAVAHLTKDLFGGLQLDQLGPVKSLLKRFFSAEPWSEQHAAELSELVQAGIPGGAGWWEHDVGGYRLMHGFRDGGYRLLVSGGSGPGGSADLFDRVFTGPVRPEATPNPRHVIFHLGGPSGASRWYGSGDEIGDPRVARLFENEQVADVLVSPSFVTVGLRRSASWEEQLDPMLDLVTELFWPPGEGGPTPVEGIRTRAELVEGGAADRRLTVEELHLLDPDEKADREVLLAALQDGDARLRRVAVAVLGQAEDRQLALRVLIEQFGDPSRVVRRTVVDSAVDAGDERLRRLFERALDDDDPWIRWKSVRGLSELGLGSSRLQVAALRADPDFQVRFEVAAALRES